MALYLAIVIVLIPFELGYLFFRARTEGVSLATVVRYREPVPRGEFVALVLVAVIWASLDAMLLFPPLDEFFIDTFFFWLPDWFFMAEDFAQYSAAALLITWVFGLLANGIAGPVVEELYFRGTFCRGSRGWGMAPVVNTVLFSLSILHAVGNIGASLRCADGVRHVVERNVYLAWRCTSCGTSSMLLCYDPSRLVRCGRDRHRPDA